MISCTPNKFLSFSKESFCKSFGHDICNHVPGRTINHLDFIGNNSFANKIMTNVNVSSSVMVFGILCQFRGSLVVFVDCSRGIHLSPKIFQ